MTIDEMIKKSVAEAVAPLVTEIQSLKRKVDPPKEWLTVKEYAAAYNVGVSTVYRWIEEGKVETKGVGKQRRIRC